MTIDLLPCPFCGGEASAEGYATYSPPLKDTRWDDGTKVAEAFFCNCIKCGIDNKVGAVGHRTSADAIAYWNRRADLSPSPEVVKELVAKFTALEKAASEVSRRGAETGPQWSKLTIAILQARAALAKLEGGE